MRISHAAFSALVISAFLAGAANAATPVAQLKNVDGKVYVNKGKGFTPVTGSVELQRGDRVMIGEKGSAAVNYYLAGCDVMLTSSSMTTISSKAPCKGKSQLTTQGLESSSGGGSSIGPVIPIVGAAGMVGLGIYVATKDDDNNNDDDDGQSP